MCCCRARETEHAKTHHVGIHRGLKGLIIAPRGTRLNFLLFFLEGFSALARVCSFIAVPSKAKALL
jgi:hypothetical protein